MGLVDEIRLQGVVTRISEEMLYAEVLREIEKRPHQRPFFTRAGV